MRYLVIIAIIVYGIFASAQTLYRYKDDNGVWQFADRPPQDKRDTQSERLTTRNYTPIINIEAESTDAGLMLVATNEWHCPMQVKIEFIDVVNIPQYITEPIDIVLPPDSTTDLIELYPENRENRYSYRIQYSSTHGDPTARIDRNYRYAMPFARGTEFTVTQAYPSTITHGDAGNRYAIDLAMPEGTPVYAVRDGVVFATSYEHYSGGTDRQKDLPKANVVRIVHDDATMAVYAHLSWNAIRVKPGQRVKRGQYIADSGNTGFSSGPHLHFALQANNGETIESIPLVFQGSGTQAITAVSGQVMHNSE